MLKTVVFVFKGKIDYKSVTFSEFRIDSEYRKHIYYYYWIEEGNAFTWVLTSKY